MAITIRIGKVLAGPPVGKPVVDIIADDVEEAEIYHLVESGKLDEVIDDTLSNSQQVDKLKKNKGKEVEVVVTTLLKPPLPFPHQLEKKANDTKFSKFMDMLKQLTINLPLVEALEQMPWYAKFIKDLITKKRLVSFELMDILYYCGIISTRSLV